MSAAAQTPEADHTFYTDRATFEAANPGLILEDFTGTLVPDGNVISCAPPLNSATNDACFPTAGVAPGFDLGFTDDGGTGSYVTINNLFGVACVEVGPNSFVDELDLDFTPAVLAAGFDLYTPLGGADGFTIEAFGPGGSLGSTAFTSNSATASFFGVDTTNPLGITRIEVREDVDNTGELICDLQFGPPQCVLRARIENPVVGSDDLLTFGFRLEHLRPQTANRAFVIRIQDLDGTVLFRRETPTYTIEYLDVINHRWTVDIPRRLGPGEYILGVGIAGMTQGTANARERFTVLPPGRVPSSGSVDVLPEPLTGQEGESFTVAPASRVVAPSSVILPERLTGQWTAVAAVGETPAEHALMQNYPNPFNPSTEIGFDLPESGAVHLAVYDVLGRQVQLLVDRAMEAGTHQVVFDASDLPSGTYLYRLETAQGTLVRTMLLVK